MTPLLPSAWMFSTFCHRYPRNHASSLRLSGSILILLSCLSLPQMSHAFHQPLWELGAGIATLSAPHYRGSKTKVNLTLPFPYILYRGETLRIERGGVRSDLYRNEHITLNLSLSGSIPVPDTDDGARSGMPGLDSLIEAGPELSLDLWRSAKHDEKLDLVVPIRAVYSIGDPLIKHRGFTVSPYLSYKMNRYESDALIRYSFGIGPIYADRWYHDYFYTVEPEFEISGRRAYEAAQGYSGSRMTISISKVTKNYSLSVFARYDNLSGAAFASSPLVETDDYFVFGMVFVWIFSVSETTVPHDEAELE